MTYGFADVMNLIRLLDAGETPETQRRIERQKTEALIGYCERCPADARSCLVISASRSRAVR
jgi:hypothetical protein